MPLDQEAGLRDAGFSDARTLLDDLPVFHHHPFASRGFDCCSLPLSTCILNQSSILLMTIQDVPKGSTPRLESAASPMRIWWSNAIFFVGVHFAAVIGIYYWPYHEVPRATLVLSVMIWQLADFGYVAFA